MKFNINGKEIEVADDVLSKAIEEKTTSIDLQSDLVVRTAEEEAKFKSNIAATGQSAAFEIGRKEVLKGLGIEVNGQHKSDETAVEAINSFINTRVLSEMEKAKLEPNKQVAELQKDKQALVENLTNLQTQFESFKGETVAKQQEQTRRTTFAELVPENVINRNNALDLMSMRIKTGFTDEGVLFGIGADGQPMKDPSTMELLPIKAAVQSFFDDNRDLLKEAKGGAGGGDSGAGGGKQSLESFTEEMQKAGYQVNGSEFNAELTARIAAGTLDY
jgi:hypothetical protein